MGFADNFMKLSSDKCHILVLRQLCGDLVTVEIGNTDVVNGSDEKWEWWPRGLRHLWFEGFSFWGVL